MLHQSLIDASNDGAVPYWRLWAACFLGFGAIGMTMQVMPAYAHERLERMQSPPAWR